MASMRPARKFFGHRRDAADAWPRRRSSPGWSRRRRNYSPTADAEAAVGRAGVVLAADARDRRDHARPRRRRPIPAAVKLAPEPKQNSVRYFTDWALPQLDTADRRDSTSRSTSGRRSTSACSAPPTPRSAPTRRAGAQGALVSLDRDGAVRAMVGGKDYVSSIYNRATQAVRQPGSAFKLFVYLAALEAGTSPRTRSSTSR